MVFYKSQVLFIYLCKLSEKSKNMNKLLYIISLCVLISCTKESVPYSSMNAEMCDSILKNTALSCSERAKVTYQYILLHTPGRGPIRNTTSSKQDTCLAMLQEMIPLVTGNLRTKLQIAILPFHLSKFTSYTPGERHKFRQIMSDIENSTLTPEDEAWYLNYKAQFFILQRASAEAFRLCEEARNKFRINNDLQGEFCTLFQMSMLHMFTKDYLNALRYCDSAQNLNNYTPSPPDQQRLYHQYSILYSHLGAYEKAITARKKSGQDTISNSSLVNLYISAKQYSNALNILQHQKEANPSNLYRLNYYLRSEAEIYEALGQSDKAAILRNQAIQLAEENSRNIKKNRPDIPGIPSAFAQIYADQAEWKWKNGKRQEAFDLLQKAEILTRRNQEIKKEHIPLIKSLAHYYQEFGDYRTALLISQRCDSLQKIVDARHTPEDYENILAAHELEMLNATISKQKAEKRAIFFSHSFKVIGIGLLLACIILSIRYYRIQKYNYKNQSSKPQ